MMLEALRALAPSSCTIQAALTHDADAVDAVMEEHADGIDPQKVAPYSDRVETFIRPPHTHFDVSLLHEAVNNAKMKKTLTHTSMIGGRFNRLAVHPDRLNEFRVLLSQLVEAGSNCFVVEKLIDHRPLETGAPKTTSYNVDIDKMPLPISERILIAAVTSRVLSELTSKQEDTRTWVALPCHVMCRDPEGKLHPYTGSGVAEYHPIPNGNMHLHGPAVKTNESPAITEEVFRRVLGMPSVFPELTRQVRELVDGDTGIETALGSLFQKGVVDSSISSLRVPGALKCKNKKLVNKAYMAVCSLYTDADGEVHIEQGPEALSADTMRPEDGRAGWAKLFRVLGVQLDAEVESVINTSVISKFVTQCTRKAQSTFNRGMPSGSRVSLSQSGGFKNSELFCHSVSEAMQVGRDAEAVRNSFVQDTWKKLASADFLPSFMAQLLTMFNGVLRHGSMAPLSSMPIATIRVFPQRWNYCIITLPQGLPKVCGRRSTPHGSNNQYIIVDAGRKTAVLRCHDPECKRHDTKHGGVPQRCLVHLSATSVEELSKLLPQKPLTASQQEAIINEASRKRPTDEEQPKERAKRMWEAMKKAYPNGFD